jgi:hypothetical protein
MGLSCSLARGRCLRVLTLRWFGYDVLRLRALHDGHEAGILRECFRATDYTVLTPPSHRRRRSETKT